MKGEKGIWKISKGKNNRFYINCNQPDRLIHPDLICDINGLGIYGYDQLRDLAVAILLFEKEKQKEESILSKLIDYDNRD